MDLSALKTFPPRQLERFREAIKMAVFGQDIFEFLEANVDDWLWIDTTSRIVQRSGVETMLWWRTRRRELRLF